MKQLQKLLEKDAILDLLQGIIGFKFEPQVEMPESFLKEKRKKYDR